MAKMAKMAKPSSKDKAAPYISPISVSLVLTNSAHTAYRVWPEP